MICPRCRAPLERRAIAGGVEVDVCGHCYGVFYDRGEIAVPLELSHRRSSGLLCPKDKGAMAIGSAYDGKIEIEQCERCGGYWLDAGEIQKLRKITGVDQIVREPGADAAESAGPAAAMIPPLLVAGTTVVRPAADPPPPRAPKVASRAEPSAAAPKTPAPGRYKTLRRAVPPTDGAYATNPDQATAPVMRLDGRRYQHYQTSRPRVMYALGEFNWRVRVGDEARARDFIHPPHILSQDISAGDYVWSHGEYVEGTEIWEAFKLEGHPPVRHGVNPAQPNPHAAAKAVVGRWFMIFVSAACALFFVLALLARNRVVYKQSFAYQPKPGVDASFVTPEFKLGGRVSNVKVRIDTNLSNMWIFFRIALINAETDTALDFDREVSYYYGRSGGESWSEGSRKDVVYLPKVAPGTYYLRVDPESKGAVDYTLTVTRDVPRMSYLVVAVFLLGLPALWAGWRYMAFEKQRWHESDHPWVEEE